MADFHKTPNLYPNFSASPLNVSLSATSFNDQQHFRLNKINRVKDYFVLKLKKEN